MARRIAFHFFPGESILHRWDARCKFIGLSLLTLALLQMNFMSLAAFSFLFVGALAVARVPCKEVLCDLKAWVWFLLIIFLLQASFHPGVRLQNLGWLPVSIEGIRQAALTCWRLALIVCYAILYTAVTRPRDLQDAVSWLLSPIPFLPARRIALMVTLTVRFLPQLLDQSEEIQTATIARLGDQKKGIVRRLRFFILPLFRNSIKRSDELALALAARGYREDLPGELPGIPFSHLIPLVVLTIVAALSTEWMLALIRKLL